MKDYTHIARHIGELLTAHSVAKGMNVKKRFEHDALDAATVLFEVIAHILRNPRNLNDFRTETNRGRPTHYNPHNYSAQEVYFPNPPITEFRFTVNHF